MTEDLYVAARKVLLRGLPLRRKISDRTYELKGINSQMYRFLLNNSIMSQVFSGIDDYDNRLIKILGGDLQDERIGEAARFMTDLWHLEPGLPCYPLIENLGEMEFGRAFWRGHRDHIVHQFLVYLLGLYLYYGCKRLKDALTNDMPEEEFLRAWKIAALFHDLGYVFEVEHERRGPIYDQVFDELNDLRRWCIYYYFVARGIPILRAENRRIREHGEIFIQEVDRGQILTLSRFGPEDLFSRLEPRVEHVRLGRRGSSLIGYWKYAQNNSPRDGSNRRYIVDHGIAGALVLLQQYRSLEYSVDRALPVVQQTESLVTDETCTRVIDSAQHIANCRLAVEYAAVAISLHNINVEIWDRDHAFDSESLTLNRYCLSLQQSPLAFFLTLVDALQSWDRPRYTMPRSPDYVLQAQDMAIGFGFQEEEKGKIVVTYKTDDYRGRSGSVFAQKLEEMAKYMKSEDLKALLKEGD